MTRKAATTGNEYEFSYTVDSYAIRIDEEPLAANDLAQSTVPIGIFAADATLRALVRYLRDTRGLTTAQTARLLGRTPQCIAASHHAASALPAIDEDDLRVPVRIFRRELPPLEALVTYLRETGVRNADIARLLRLDPRTTWTAASRAKRRMEVRE